MLVSFFIINLYFEVKNFVFFNRLIFFKVWNMIIRNNIYFKGVRLRYGYFIVKDFLLLDNII